MHPAAALLLQAVAPLPNGIVTWPGCNLLFQPLALLPCWCVQVGDLVYARVESAHRDLEPVLSCMDAAGKVRAGAADPCETGVWVRRGLEPVPGCTDAAARRCAVDMPPCEPACSTCAAPLLGTTRRPVAAATERHVCDAWRPAQCQSCLSAVPRLIFIHAMPGPLPNTTRLRGLRTSRAACSLKSAPPTRARCSGACHLSVRRGTPGSCWCRGVDVRHASRRPLLLG